MKFQYFKLSYRLRVSSVIPSFWPASAHLCVRDHSTDYLGMAARLGDYHVVTAGGSHQMLFANPEDYTKASLKLVSAVYY